MIENAEDIIRILRTKGIDIPTSTEQVFETKKEPSESIDLISYLAHTPISLDELQEQSKLPMNIIRKELARLEIQGRVISNPNGEIMLKK